MSLKQFHILFISLAVVLLIGFGIWTLLPVGGQAAAAYLPWGLFSFLMAGFLIVYEVKMLKRIKNLVVPILVFSCSASAEACSMCFSTSTSNQAQAAAVKWGVLSLFIILVGVLIILAKFFYSVAKKSRQLPI